MTQDSGCIETSEPRVQTTSFTPNCSELLLISILNTTYLLEINCILLNNPNSVLWRSTLGLKRLLFSENKGVLWSNQSRRPYHASHHYLPVSSHWSVLTLSYVCSFFQSCTYRSNLLQWLNKRLFWLKWNVFLSRWFSCTSRRPAFCDFLRRLSCLGTDTSQWMSCWFPHDDP